MIETYVIHVTKECNCDCAYCYEQDKSSTYSWDEIKKLLDSILEYAPDEFGIEFLGGEPMLRFDLIQKVIDYVPQAQWFGITTNGTIVTDELIDLLKSNKSVTWAASIDGHIVANMLRKDRAGHNTYDKVIENYHKLRQAGVDYGQISYHMTIHPYNVGHLSDSVRHLYDLGLTHGAAGIVESTMELDDSFFDRYELEMQKVSRMIHEEHPDLSISELHTLKPREDVRHYIRDDSGKVIGESYGRSPGDITEQSLDGIYPQASGPSEASDRISDVREKVYQYHNRHGRYYGIGTGRNGSKTLADFFRQKFNTMPVLHEPTEFIPWEFDREMLHDIIERNAHIVSSSLINYAELLIRNFDSNFVCIKRDKEEFIQSFLRAHTLFPNQKWADVQNPQQFPEYPEGTTMIDGLGLYWDDYYAKAEGLRSKYEERFQLIAFEDFINRDEIKTMRQQDEDYQSRLCACRKGEEKGQDQGA